MNCNLRTTALLSTFQVPSSPSSQKAQKSLPEEVTSVCLAWGTGKVKWLLVAAQWQGGGGVSIKNHLELECTWQINKEHIQFLLSICLVGSRNSSYLFLIAVTRLPSSLNASLGEFNQVFICLFVCFWMGGNFLFLFVFPLTMTFYFRWFEMS